MFAFEGHNLRHLMDTVLGDKSLTRQRIKSALRFMGESLQSETAGRKQYVKALLLAIARYWTQIVDILKTNTQRRMSVGMGVILKVVSKIRSALSTDLDEDMNKAMKIINKLDPKICAQVKTVLEKQKDCLVKYRAEHGPHATFVDYLKTINYQSMTNNNAAVPSNSSNLNVNLNSAILPLSKACVISDFIKSINVSGGADSLLNSIIPHIKNVQNLADNNLCILYYINSNSNIGIVDSDATNFVVAANYVMSSRRRGGCRLHTYRRRGRVHCQKIKKKDQYYY